MVTTDFSKGYHHMDLDPNFFQYFGFEWKGKWYYWRSLPFGLSSACWAFTKLTRELRVKWRKMGRRCGGYLDDGIHADKSSKSLKSFVGNCLIPDLESCGFVVNLEKSILKPTQVVTYLGMTIDTLRKCCQVPDRKREIVIQLIQKALQHKSSCSVHLLEIVAGNLISMHWAFGRLARLMTMSLYKDINSVPHKNWHIILSDTTIHDLNFWLCSFDRYNGFKPLWSPSGFHTRIHTDAAGISIHNFGGWAGWSYTKEGHLQIAKGVWNESLALDHSTLQELLAAFNTIKSFNRNKELSNKRVLLRTDNEGVSFIINKAGSRDSYTHQICKELLWYCMEQGIDLWAEWIPRDKNQFADFHSRHTDSGDYKLNPSVFAELNQAWGPFDVDLFASFDNHQLPRYYSRFHTPNCQGIDAFTFHWGNGQNNWANPPFKFISRAWCKAKECKARLTMLVPFTPSALWWHLITPDGEKFSSHVHAFRVIPRAPDLFLAGRMGYKSNKRTPRWDSLALQLDFSRRIRHCLSIPHDH
jgi:hypothetical protein